MSNPDKNLLPTRYDRVAFDMKSTIVTFITSYHL